MKKQFYVYMITNKNKTVLYTGVTNDIQRRLREHLRGELEGFARQYQCKYLVYFETYCYINDAISREKQIKKYSRKKKEMLIDRFNPGWRFLNYCYLL